MKAMIAAAVVIALIGVGSYFILDALGFSSAATFTGNSVRLD